MNTRKYPRSLTEAFGPYAHGNQVVEPKDDPIITFDSVVGWIRNALAGVGIVACIIAIGFWSAR